MPCAAMKLTPNHGLSAVSTAGLSWMCSRPPPASARNQTTVSGPKKRATRAVPCDCTLKSPTMMTSAIGMTQCSNTGDTSRKPSTAESTEMAGVMTASP